MTPAEPPTVSQPGYLIIGPMRSGKTCLLATLETAAVLANADRPGTYSVFSENKQMQDMRQRALRDMYEQGGIHLPPSDNTTTYEATLTCPTPPPAPAGRWPRLGAAPPPPVPMSHRFQLLDGPGEALFGDEQDWKTGDTTAVGQYREQLIQQGKVSRGLIICVDADDRKMGGLFFLHLTPMLEQMSSNHRLPFDRVAVVLTKADQVVSADGYAARERLEAKNVWDQLVSVIGRGSIPNLMRYLKDDARTQVCCGWSSVYGFVPDDGSPNFEIGKDGVGRLAVFEEPDGGFLNKWEPYRVLDPFVYVATGDKMGMTPITETQYKEWSSPSVRNTR